MCDCGPQQCCHQAPMHRRFLTKDEEIKRLKAYKTDLENEIRELEEHIRTLTE